MPELFILTATRSITELGYNGLLAAALALINLDGQTQTTLKFKDCEIHIERTGKTGIIGSFAGEQFKAHYADDTGTDVRATFLASVERLSAYYGAGSAYVN
jgi:hypothetical protein